MADIVNQILVATQPINLARTAERQDSVVAVVTGKRECGAGALRR